LSNSRAACTIVDPNFHSSYMWECRQRYSPDGGYIISDAGDTGDPLYSVGTALSSAQIRQIAAINRAAVSSHATYEFTKDLDTAIATFQRGVTRDITRLYECMGDAYDCHLRVYLVLIELFPLALPSLMNEWLWYPLMAKLVNQFFKLETLEADSRKFQNLSGGLAQIRRTGSGASMNNPFYEYHREEDIPASLSRMPFSLARLRLALRGRLGWRGLIRFGQQRALLKDVLRGAHLVPFQGAKLRESTLVRMAFRSHELESAAKDKTFGRSSG
jgi:hypothetical protein